LLVFLDCPFLIFPSISLKFVHGVKVSVPSRDYFNIRRFIVCCSCGQFGDTFK
jgi:hypothetical protein